MYATTRVKDLFHFLGLSLSNIHKEDIYINVINTQTYTGLDFEPVKEVVNKG